MIAGVREHVREVMRFAAISLAAHRIAVSAIDFAAVAQANHKNSYLLVVYLGDEPVVADTVLPELAEFGAFQRLTE